jgi:hypothetical protein
MYEYDLNAILSLKLNEALKQSEKKHIIVPSQVGSRKHRSSQLPIHIEIAQLKISRLSRKEYG